MNIIYFLKKLLGGAVSGVLLCCVLLIAESSYANLQQTQTSIIAADLVLKGKVIDMFNKPMDGVQISLSVSNSVISVTDSSGSFDLSLNKQDGSIKLYFKHLGYKDQMVQVNQSLENLTVRMEPLKVSSLFSSTLPVDTITGELRGKKIPVVLKPYPEHELDILYSSVSFKEFLGAAATVGQQSLSLTPAPDYSYALAGRLPGLTLTQTEGFYMPSLTEPTEVDIFVGNIPTNNSGAGPTDNNQFNIQLRGHSGSLGQSPVVIIDGVQREFYGLDPEQIESVTVLKDGLSTLLLGQNSARGALIVTTKKPQVGPPRLSFSANVGWQTPLKLPKPLSSATYAYLLNEALQNDGKNPAYTKEDYVAYLDGSDPIGHPDVNWYDALIKEHPLLQRYHLNVTGGSSKARYLVDLGYMSQDGMFKGSDAHSYNTNTNLKRYTINSKIDFKINKDFDLGLNLIGRLMNHNQPGATTQNVLNDLLHTPNNAYPIYNPNGSFGGTSNYTNNLMAQILESGYIASDQRDILVNLDMRYKLDKWVPGWWVRLNGNIAVESASFTNRSKQVPIFTMNISKSGDTSYSRFGSTINQQNSFHTHSWARYWYAQASTGYNKQLGSHQVGAELFYDQRQTLLNYDLPSVLNNYAFKADYNYDHKYYAQLAVDYSGYSRYKKGERFGWFYAAALGWDLAQEKFIKNNVHWIDLFKIRANYAKNGNANVDYYGYYIWNHHFENVNVSYPIGSEYPNLIGGQEGQVLANVNATWEKAHKFDIGIDMAFFDHHLEASIDYYHEKYTDIMQSRGKSIALIGLQYPAENIGQALYHGFEGNLTFKNSVGNFNYYLTANAALQYSKVLFMDEQAQPHKWNQHTGLPVDQRFGLIADGFIQTNEEANSAATISGYELRVGDVRYKDLNNDGVIDKFDISAIGKTGPKLFYGLSAGLSYKGVELNVLIQGVHNRDIYVNELTTEAGFLAQNNGFGQAYENIQGRWTPETGDIAIYPALSAGGNGYNYNPLYTSSSLFLHNGNYFRLKNIGIAYSLPYKWTERLKVGSVKIFINALNLWTWAAYDQVDPEISLPHYPLQKIINTGINIKL